MSLSSVLPHICHLKNILNSCPKHFLIILPGFLSGTFSITYCYKVLFIYFAFSNRVLCIADLKLTIYIMMGSSTQRFTGICLPNDGIKVVHHLSIICYILIDSSAYFTPPHLGKCYPVGKNCKGQLQNSYHPKYL